MLKLATGFMGLCSFLVWSATASAGLITVNADSQGWITQGGSDNGSVSGNNYISGNCGLGDCGDGEYRNFFNFSLPSILGEISSARFIVNTSNVKAEQSASVTYALFSTISTASFSDLGSGTQYGSRTYTDADDNLVLGIALNGDALADILANLESAFTISGRVTSATTFGGSELNQFVFGGSTSIPQLEITTRDGSVPVPAPATLALFALGLTGLGFSKRKKA